MYGQLLVEEELEVLGLAEHSEPGKQGGGGVLLEYFEGLPAGVEGKVCFPLDVLVGEEEGVRLVVGSLHIYKIIINLAIYSGD